MNEERRIEKEIKKLKDTDRFRNHVCPDLVSEIRILEAELKGIAIGERKAQRLWNALQGTWGYAEENYDLLERDLEKIKKRFKLK